MEVDDREVDKIICSCGEEAMVDTTTKDEDNEYGCGRSECCTRAIYCGGCGVRIIFKLAAPEMSYE
jgi:hypothetical protein